MMLGSRTALGAFAALVSLAALAAPPAAHAQARAGVRGGMSANPDQVYIGGHVETPPLVDHVRFRPNVELGFGDDVTTTALNLESVYAFSSRQPWHLYAGGGPALNFYRAHGSTDSTSGLNLLVGAERRDGLFFEAKFGAFDSPDFKFGVGYTFH